MNIPEDTKQALYKNLGDETEAFLSHAAKLLEKYAGEWQLTNIEFMETNTVNLLFTCESALHGPCILKLCLPGPGVGTEINCLEAYKGKGYCKLWAYNLADHIMLLQRVVPGNQMWDIPDDKERARRMAHLIKDLHIPWDGQTPYPTYISWIENIGEILAEKGNMVALLFYVDKALVCYADLVTRHPQNCLLHGDLHQENMLLNEAGGYTIIDPEGAIGPPIIETARFLLNEMPCEKATIFELVNIIAPAVDADPKDILQSLFIDTVLTTSWTMEEHFPTPEAFDAAKREALADCQFAYELMRP